MKRSALNLTNLTGLLMIVLSVTRVAVASEFPALRDCTDPQLQRDLERTLVTHGLAHAVERKQLSLVLVDINDLSHPRLAAVNGDRMIYAASVPKIAILLGAFVEIEAGRMQLDDSTRNTLIQMIRHSSNEAASDMWHRIGEARVADILQSIRYRLYDPTQNGGLWVGKEYGKARAWKRDPLYNISHGANAMQVARFYYLLETGRLVSEPLTQEMKEILSKPAIRHKFVKGLEARPNTTIYRKSGTWRHWHADSALIETAKHKFIAVGLAAHADGGKWLEQLIVPMHDLIVPQLMTRQKSAPH